MRAMPLRKMDEAIKKMQEEYNEITKLCELAESYIVEYKNSKVEKEIIKLNFGFAFLCTYCEDFDDYGELMSIKENTSNIIKIESKFGGYSSYKFIKEFEGDKCFLELINMFDVPRYIMNNTKYDSYDSGFYFRRS